MMSAVASDWRSAIKNKPRPCSCTHSRIVASTLSARCLLVVTRSTRKRLPAELTLMQIGALGCGVGKEFSLQAGLLEVGAINRHGAAIALDEECAEPAVGIEDRKWVVRSDAKLDRGVVVVDF